MSNPDSVTTEANDVTTVNTTTAAKIDLSENIMEEDEDLTCEYCDKAFTTTKECGQHERTCKAKEVERYSVKKTTNKKKTGCSLCGATGHLPPDCYLTRHDKDF